MELQHRIDTFIDRLSSTPAPVDAHNPFAYGNKYDDLRRENLRLYLTQIADLAPTLMLLGEAPGYRGMRLTGVPMTSRRILLAGIPELGLFGATRGYQDVPEPGFERIQGEQTATAVWGTLAPHGVAALIWGAYPFHPHLPGAPLTNRKPRRSEIELGKPFVRDLITLFAPKLLVAVGNVGDETLKSLGIEHQKVRHPAQGGKNDFVRGILSILDL
jgi:hypothetical protein